MRPPFQPEDPASWLLPPPRQLLRLFAPAREIADLYGLPEPISVHGCALVLRAPETPPEVAELALQTRYAVTALTAARDELTRRRVGLPHPDAHLG